MKVKKLLGLSLLCLVTATAHTQEQELNLEYKCEPAQTVVEKVKKRVAKKLTPEPVITEYKICIENFVIANRKASKIFSTRADEAAAGFQDFLDKYLEWYRAGYPQ